MYSTSFNEEERLWVGDQTQVIFNPKASIGHILLWSLNRNPSKIIQINHETNIQLTSEFLRKQTIRAAQNLQKLGFEESDIFSIVAKNSHYVTPIVFASMCIGCRISTLDTSFNKSELLHMLEQTRPKLMFCDADVSGLVKECLNELELDIQIYSFRGKTNETHAVEDLFEETFEEEKFVAMDVDGENAIALIICTSGSTGLSKGVTLSHASILHQITEAFLRADDVCLTFSSIYWISGLILMLGCAINGCCRLVTTESFSVEIMLEMIEEHKVTVFFSASHFLVLALKCEKFYSTDLSSLRVIISSGSKLSVETAKGISKMLENCKMLVGYGMTEMGGLISCKEVDGNYDGSLGQLINGMEIKIADENGVRLTINQTGEICAKSMFQFLEYYANEEVTRHSFDKEGFLLTGDVGYFNEANELFLVDRKKDMIKYCSSQISPTEIEGLLIRLPGIKAACVVGIPDPIVGDLPAAVIIRSEIEPGITAAEIEEIVSGNLADYKKLRGGIYFVDDFPLTPSGKIVRRLIRDMAVGLYEKFMLEPNNSNDED